MEINEHVENECPEARVIVNIFRVVHILTVGKQRRKINEAAGKQCDNGGHDKKKKKVHLTETVITL